MPKSDPDVLSKKLNSKFNGTHDTSSEHSSTKSASNKRPTHSNLIGNTNISENPLAPNNSDREQMPPCSSGTVKNDANITEKAKTPSSEEDPDENDTEESEEYDYMAETDSNKKLNAKNQTNKINYDFMPHDKNVINFLINEYLLEQNYKMTHITFAEENESLDLEDWDVVGLNRSKPPNLCQLYKYYLNKKNCFLREEKAGKDKEKQQALPNTQTQTSCVLETRETGVQTILVETASVETNTRVIQVKHAEVCVNLDHDMFDTQKMQINKLLEKQEILVKSLAKLETEIETLSSERELTLMKLDMLTLELDRSPRTVRRTSQAAETVATTNGVEQARVMQKKNR